MSTVKMNFVVCLPFFSHPPRIKGELRLLDAQQVCHFRHLYSFESIYFNINSIASEREIEKSKIFPLLLEGPAAIPPPPPSYRHKQQQIQMDKNLRYFFVLLDSTQLGCGKVKGGEGATAGREGERKRINRKSFSRLVFPKKATGCSM